MKKIISFFRRISKRTYLRLLLCILAFVLVLDVVVHLVWALTPGVDTVSARTGALEETLVADAYLIRDEQLLRVDGSWHVLPAVEEGEKIKAGDVVAYLYDNKIDSDPLDQLLALFSAKRLLASIDDRRMDKVNESLKDKIGGFLRKIAEASERGDLISAAFFQKELNILLLCQKKLSDSQALSEAEVMLEQEIVALREEIGAPAGEVKAPAAGWVSFASDGYETEALSPQTMDKEALDALFSKTPVPVSGTVIGRFYATPTWYVVSRTAKESAAELKVGQKYTVSLDGVSSTVMLDRVVIDAESEDAALVFSSTALAQGLDVSRISQMTLSLENHTGLLLPTAALTEFEGVWGVYILRGFLVEFREVAVAYRDGATIVTDPSFSGSGKYRLLSESESVIVKGDDLYDGKIVS